MDKTQMSQARAELQTEVAARGYIIQRTSLTSTDLTDRMLAIGHVLGEPLGGRFGKAVEELKPVRERQAHISSLSRQHGLNALPLHTDGAHRQLPPRFLLLGCLSPGSCYTPTIILPFRRLHFTPQDRTDIGAGVFSVRNGRSSFYASILNLARSYVRFDEGCMSPIDAKSIVAHKAFATRFDPREADTIDWEPGSIAILDNWQVLHGRGRGSAIASEKRKLLRVCVQ